MLFQHKPLNCLFGIIWSKIYFLCHIPSYRELVGTGSIKQTLSSNYEGCCSIGLFAAPWTAAHQAPLSFTVSLCLLNSCPLKLSNHLILCHPLLLLPSSFPSIRVFFKELVLCIGWSKFWGFSTSPSSEYAGLISFRTDGFYLLAVQGTLKSLIQHHNLKP